MTKNMTLSSKGYYANKLLNKIHRMNTTLQKPIDLALIEKAIYYLEQDHQTNEHKLKKQAYIKPLSITLMLTEYCLSTEALATSLLYELVLQKTLKQEILVQEFNRKVANKMQQLMELEVAPTKDSVRNIDELIENGEIDVLMIQLLNNLYVMQHIGSQPKWEQLEAALQCIQTFLPLAGYLDVSKIESELATICKRIVIPELAQNTSTELNTDINFAFFKP